MIESSESDSTTSPASNDSKPVIYSRDSHCISRGDIDPDALKIMYRLVRHGFKAYLVGGGVRDLLLDKPPKDFDITTDATPGRIRSLFRNSRIIGRRFKLAHIYFKNHKIIEVSTFRDISDPIDLEDDLSPEEQIIIRDNKYGTEATDAVRRDITINALFYDLSTFSIIDYVGGMKDLEAGIIRVIGESDVRFAEDPVRLIRVVRHAARAGFEIDSECYEAILRNHELITHSPPMRIYEEVKKDLVSGYLLRIIQLLHATSLLQHILPELAANDGSLLEPDAQLARAVSEIDRLVHAGETIPLTAILGVFALFFHRAPEERPENIAGSFRTRTELKEYLDGCFTALAVPRKEREKIEDAVSLWWKTITTDPDRVKISSLERRKCVLEVYWMFRITTQEDERDAQPESVLEKLASAVKARESHLKRRGSKEKRDNRSRGRGSQKGQQSRKGDAKKSTGRRKTGRSSRDRERS